MEEALTFVAQCRGTWAVLLVLVIHLALCLSSTKGLCVLLCLPPPPPPPPLSLLHPPDVVSMLIDSHPQVVMMSVRPLILACQSGRVEVAEILLEAGMDPNLVGDKSGTSPLHEAMRFYREDIAKLLLKFGADPDRENRQNEVSVYVCVCGGGTSDGCSVSVCVCVGFESTV